jgi:predicted DCC family thiol-disulfide oxidoreductase YuxK
VSIPTENPAQVVAEEPLTTPEHPLLLFYDGDCSFCARWVESVMRADSAHRIRVGKQQGTTFQRVRERFPKLGKLESVVLVKRRPGYGEEFFTRSTAIRKLIDGLPGFRIFATILHLVPTPLSDLGYWIVAKLREPLFSRWADCRPHLEKSALFVD